MRLYMLALVLLLAACSIPARAQISGRVAEAAREWAEAQRGKLPELLLFGGRNHDEYLGCLVCNPVKSDSICNPYGRFGSPVSSRSIWQPFGAYGNHFRRTSPWNTFGSEPPVIVDRAGRFYGEFTINSVRLKRTRIPQLAVWLDRLAAAAIIDLEHAREEFCGS